MLTEEMRIVNQLGMHARPAAALVQTVLKFQSDVHLNLNGHRINAKSIMGVLTLAAAQGSIITVTCEGVDEADAMSAIRDLIAAGFGED